MRFVIDSLYLLTLIVISPKVIYRMVKHNRYRGGWRQRLGDVKRRKPGSKCIWIHAVSVGEVNATRTIIDMLEKELVSYEIVLSSTTDTGFARAKSLYSDRLEVFYFPADISFVMGRAFEKIRPDVILTMELELWPNLVNIANSKNVPVVVVNGRISDRSFPRYLKIKSLVKRMFAKASLVLAQTQEYADRFIQLGCDSDKVIVTGSLKYDTAEVGDRVDGSQEVLTKINIEGKQLITAGGTGPGEEEIILNVFDRLKDRDGFGDIRLAIVPRKPERFEEVAKLISDRGFTLTRYSEIKANSGQEQNDAGAETVVLVDTMGDLRKFYSLSTINFVGRSLVPMGGSDMMESAALKKCTIFGKHTFNFTQTVEALLEGNGAIEVDSESSLEETIAKCLSDKDYAQLIAGNGQRVIVEHQGATKRSVEAIRKLLAD